LHGADARLITADWHRVRDDHDADATRRMRKVIEVVSAIRSIRGEMNVNPGKRIEAVIACGEAVRADLETQQRLMMSLAKLDSLDWRASDADVDGAAVAPLADATVYLPLAGLVDVKEELARLQKNMARLDKDIAMREGKLANPRFRDNAPEAVVAKVQTELNEAKDKRAEMAAGLDSLKAIDG